VGTTVSEGLRDVVIANSAICIIDGKEGRLRYRGVDIGDLAQYSTYEETTYLLWFGELPTQEQLDALRKRMVVHRELDESVQKVIKALPKTLQPMDALRTIVSVLPGSDPRVSDNSYEANTEKAIRLTASLPTMVAYYQRHVEGQEFVHPDPSLSRAANFLYMLHGRLPSSLEAETMDLALVLMAEHDLNASTFAARVTASTLSDLYSTITTAIGTLKGPLHGGASQWTMEMMLKIGNLDNVESYIKSELAAKRRIPGFGHRVYRKMIDPRAVCFQKKLKDLCEEAGDMHWYDMATKIAEVVFESSGLYPNVDYFGGPVLYMLGIPLNLFTPIFAISRVAGWIAHMFEQYADNQLLRPLSNYVGEREKAYVPIQSRNSYDEKPMLEAERPVKVS
jgi:citrate synthase